MYLLDDVVSAYIQGMTDAERLVRHMDGVGTSPSCADYIRQAIDGRSLTNGETAIERARRFAIARQ